MAFRYLTWCCALFVLSVAIAVSIAGRSDAFVWVLPHAESVSAIAVDAKSKIPSLYAVKEDEIIRIALTEKTERDSLTYKLSAPFVDPTAVTVDLDGKVIIVDAGSKRIEKFDPDTGLVTTLARFPRVSKHVGSSLIKSPSGVAIEKDGRLIIADRRTNRILRLDPVAREVTSLAGNGSRGFSDGVGEQAQFHKPGAVAVDANGMIVVADTKNHCIRLLDPQTRQVSTLAGKGRGLADGVGEAAKFNRPTGITIDSAGRIVVSDSRNYRIRRVDPRTGSVSTIMDTFNILDTKADYGVTAMDILNIHETGNDPRRVDEITIPGNIALTPSGGIFVLDHGRRIGFIGFNDRLECELEELVRNPENSGLRNRLLREMLTDRELPCLFRCIRGSSLRTSNFLGSLPVELHEELTRFTLESPMKRLRLLMALQRIPNSSALASLLN